jgi:hypothetical protein
MSNLLNDVQILDGLIRELEKINAKLENGHIVYAWRDNRRVLAKIQEIKKVTILRAETQEEVVKNEE